MEDSHGVVSGTFCKKIGLKWEGDSSRREKL